jgi:PhnB protein
MIPSMSESLGQVPDGYHSVNPYIVVTGVEGLIDFLRTVFGGVERGKREISADGTIGHAEVQIGDSVVMLSEGSAAYSSRPSVCFTYVADVDSVVQEAVAAGAELILEPTDQPWGDRVGGFHDPFDNRWWVATRWARAM